MVAIETSRVAITKLKILSLNAKSKNMSRLAKRKYNIDNPVCFVALLSGN